MKSKRNDFRYSENPKGFSHTKGFLKESFKYKWMTGSEVIVSPDSNGEIIFSIRTKLLEHNNPFTDRKIIWSITRASEKVFVLHPFYADFRIEVKNDER